VLLGAVLRVLFDAGNWSSPFFAEPLVDAKDFHEKAMLVARGDGYPPRPYERPPLFTYFVALIYRVAGPDPKVVIGVQHVLGLLTIAMTARLGARLFGRRVGLIAGCVLAAARLPLVLEGELLNETLQTCLIVLALLLFDLALARGRPAPLIGATAAGALSILARPTSALVIVPGLFGILFARRVDGGGARIFGWRSILAALAVFAAVASAAMIRNRVAGGEWVIVSYNGGINFFVGNASRHDELIDIGPGMRWERLVQTPRALETEGVFRIDPWAGGFGAWDRRYYRAALEDMAAAPGAAAARLLRKAAQFWAAREIDRNVHPSAFLPQGSLLSRITIPFAAIGGVALAGTLWLARRRSWRDRLVVAAVAGTWLTCVIFFVTSRYRMSAYPALAVAAAAFIVRLVEAAREGRARRGRALPGLVLLLAAALAFSFADPGGARRIAPARGSYLEGVARERMGDFPGAAAAYERSLVEYPRDADVLFGYGTLLVQLNQPTRAIPYLERAARALPDHPMPSFNLGLAYLMSDRHADAARELRRRLTLGSVEAKDHFNLGLALLGDGRPAEALEALDAALARAPGAPFPLIEKARALLRLGRMTEGRAAIAEAVRLDPSARTILSTDPELVDLLP
jgi:4-amino-4-deoxy-L-arabinose transferase-like glycosyltransferase